VGRKQRRSIRYESFESEPPSRPQKAPDAPPEIHLRKLRFEAALTRLEQQLRAFQRQGRREVLVVHGKGQGSPGGHGVIGPAVREWCDAHPGLVASWREAPPQWGGEGAIVVVIAE
jgi:DNA-nicking Smr family endonuclease